MSERPAVARFDAFGAERVSAMASSIASLRAKKPPRLDWFGQEAERCAVAKREVTPTPFERLEALAKGLIAVTGEEMAVQHYMKTEKTHDLWRVHVKESLVRGQASKSEGIYIVQVTLAAASAYLNNVGYPMKEADIAESVRAWVARSAVDWHFHTTYSNNAHVTVTSSAEESLDPQPNRDPDNVVAGVPLWEISAK